MTLSINKKALEIVKEIIDRQEALDCSVRELDNGTTLIDAGIDSPGSIEAGRLIGEICLGGLGTVRVTETHIGDLTLPAVIVNTDNPKIATLGSQYAGWSIRVDKYLAKGSGPVRALAVAEKLYNELEYHDRAKRGVIVLETRTPPSENVTEFIADKCGISPANLFCIVVPAASLAGSVQGSSRIVEVGVRKLHELAYDIDKIKTAHGVAPIAPVAKNDNRAMSATHDCILYGGKTFYFVEPSDDDNLAVLIEKATSSVSSQYGQPFYKLFKGFGFDFHKVDPLLFSPAEITINDIKTGNTYKAGSLNPEVLKQSFGM
ncbi:MAG: methenyltetrahydromethanopterin cyclohydrolase [Candidatus Thorarchaeota archaeon]